MPDTNQTSSKAVERLCRVLKSETLDPAKKEADDILNKARERADENHRGLQKNKLQRFLKLPTTKSC